MIVEFNNARQAPVMSRIISKEEALELALELKEIYIIATEELTSSNEYAFTDHFGIPPHLTEYGLVAISMPFPVPVGTDELHRHFITDVDAFIENFHPTDTLIIEEKPIPWVNFQQFMNFYTDLVHEFEQEGHSPIRLGDRFMKAFDISMNPYLKNNENSQVFWYILENYVKLNL